MQAPLRASSATASVLRELEEAARVTRAGERRQVGVRDQPIIVVDRGERTSRSTDSAAMMVRGSKIRSLLKASRSRPTGVPGTAGRRATQLAPARAPRSAEPSGSTGSPYRPRPTCSIACSDETDGMEPEAKFEPARVALDERQAFDVAGADGRMSTTVIGMNVRTCATKPSMRDPTSTCAATAAPRESAAPPTGPAGSNGRRRGRPPRGSPSGSDRRRTTPAESGHAAAAGSAGPRA